MITRDSLMQRWQSLASREKSMLVTGAVLLVLIILYLIVEPALLRRERLAGDIPRLREDLAWMQSQLAELQQLRGVDGASAQARMPLSVAMVEELLHQVDIYDQVADLRPVQGQSVMIRFKQVGHDKLMEFLSALRDRAVARVSLASIERVQDQPGRVEASVTLSPDS